MTSGWTEIFVRPSADQDTRSIPRRDTSYTRACLYVVTREPGGQEHGGCPEVKCLTVSVSPFMSFLKYLGIMSYLRTLIFC